MTDDNDVDERMSRRWVWEVVLNVSLFSISSFSHYKEEGGRGETGRAFH